MLLSITYFFNHSQLILLSYISFLTSCCKPQRGFPWSCCQIPCCSGRYSRSVGDWMGRQWIQDNSSIPGSKKPQEFQPGSAPRLPQLRQWSPTCCLSHVRFLHQEKKFKEHSPRCSFDLWRIYSPAQRLQDGPCCSCGRVGTSKDISWRWRQQPRVCNHPLSLSF